VERQRVTRLIEYVNGLNDNLDGRELYAEYKNEIEAVKPQEAFEVFKSLLDDNVPPKDILIFLDKAINAFYNSLINYKWQSPSNDNFLKDMLLENEALVKKTDEIKSLMKVGDLKTKKESILKKIIELEEFNHHYLKKENILFPYMEKKMDKFEGLKIMWSLHDVVRNQIKTAEDVLSDEYTTEQQVNSAIASLFFGILGVKKKEELILFPAACEVLTEKDWREMHMQSFEYKFPFIGESVNADAVSEAESGLFSNGRFKTDTGELTFDEMLMVFSALPVDLTFVDENNRVRFFTNPKDRIFPRSAAVIGRDVKNCHPPESVHVVEEIIESFRSGRETTAKFWINMRGKIILIQYFALFDSSGKYRGVLEASQDITEIKSFDGERRLLKWERQ